uniref:Uncharacterized protein n=1 Tax=Medicago truncatula TaxID=3880 RepID=I3S7R7_MEDTR|nr:unknown [Medicago truncatula]
MVSWCTAARPHHGLFCHWCQAFIRRLSPSAWSEGRGCTEACKSIGVSVKAHSWYNCSHLLCTSSNLHVA